MLENLKRNLEVIGGIAVIASLLIVAYEIRQNTIALQATAMQESTTILREQVMILATNPDLSRLMASDFEQLDADEQQRVKWSSRSFWFGYQGQFRQWRIGLLPDNEWRTWLNISQLWPYVRPVLMPDFVDFVEANCGDPDNYRLSD